MQQEAESICYHRVSTVQSKHEARKKERVEATEERKGLAKAFKEAVKGLRAHERKSDSILQSYYTVFSLILSDS